MTTLEQELEQLIADADYRVQIWAGDDSISITLLYLPKLSVRGEGALAYIANGKIGNKWFRGRRKWPKAQKWLAREVAGHRNLIRTLGQA